MAWQFWPAHGSNAEGTTPSNTTTSPAPSQSWNFMPAHGSAYTNETASEAGAYISSHMIYVIAFILLSLAIYWTLGSKATFYFLLLVLSGQLLTNASFLKQVLTTNQS